jgi:arylformamidase
MARLERKVQKPAGRAGRDLIKSSTGAIMEIDEEIDRAYQNGAFIAGGDAFAARWQAEAATFRAAQGAFARLEQAYGPHPRHQFDLFRPAGPPRGLVIFVHGGYWRAFDKDSWSHLAAGPVGHGWAVAIPSYRLAPEAGLPAIREDVALAVAQAMRLVEGPVVLTGHSAGGHLVARLAQTGAAGARLRRVVPISPLADLRPLCRTAMNADLKIDAAVARTESPALLAPPGVAAHVVVGGSERPAFLWQARTLSEAWACDWSVLPGRHHFDVIDGLGDPASGLSRLVTPDR